MKQEGHGSLPMVFRYIRDRALFYDHAAATVGHRAWTNSGHDGV